MRIRLILAAITLLAFGACNSSSSESSPATSEASEAPAPAEGTEEAGEGNENGSGQFGSALTDRELTPLTQIIANPNDFNGQTVKTEGEIARVCQQMGCWMELRPEGAEAQAVRVPMAGHDFFIPRDSSGRHAVIEGPVALRELSQAERDHLEAEGAEATAGRLQISATGVAIQ